MALNHRVVSSRFPYLPLHLALGDRTADVDALLDTGFDGDVVLPPGLVMDNSQPPDEYLQWTLADGSEVLAPAFLGTARVGELAPFPVLITALGDEPLVGRGVSDRFLVMLDHGHQVIVEP
ncbi:MAG: hypothetical protein HY690_08710 [Chloroflexi bacterium]|nr:hypothetical protein [Chloroflexota bacterium]